MKTFKSFLLDQINEVAKPKAKGEKDFFDAHKVEISDPEDQKNNSAKVVTKDGSGKRKADRLDNKQEMGEEVEIAEGKVKELMMDINVVADKMEKNKMLKPFAGKFVTAAKKSLDIKKSLEDVLPDYISGAEIAKLYKEEVEVKDINATILSVIRGKIEETAAASTIGGLKSGEGKIKQGSSDQSVAYSSKDPASTIGGRKGSEGKIKQGSSDENTPDKAKGNPVSTIGGVKWGGDKGVIKQGSSDESTPDKGGVGSREKEGKIKQGSSDEKTPDSGSGDAIKTIGGHRNREATAMNQGSSKVKIPEETDFTKKQTTMAHAIGKHFAKKKVGDADKGGPYAVATAMVRDKPDSAEKAYKTIKAKAKNEEHEIALVALYDELNEDNKDALLEKLDRDYDNLINFAMSVEVLDDN